MNDIETEKKSSYYSIDNKNYFLFYKIHDPIWTLNFIMIGLSYILQDLIKGNVKYQD